MQAISDTNSEKVADRLRSARIALGLTQPLLSEITGIPVATVKKYEGAKSIPGGEALAGLAKAGINVHWLATGDGPMLQEGRSKEAHHLMVRELAGEYGAAEERGRFRAPREVQMREAGQIVMQAISEVNFEPGALWVTVLQEMVLTYSMPPAAVRRLVETLAASQARRPNSPASD